MYVYFIYELRHHNTKLKAVWTIINVADTDDAYDSEDHLKGAESQLLWKYRAKSDDLSLDR